MLLDGLHPSCLFVLREQVIEDVTLVLCVSHISDETLLHIPHSEIVLLRLDDELSRSHAVAKEPFHDILASRFHINVH